MDDIRDRFHRLDRMTAPDLWNESVGRAAELEAAPRRSLNPGMVLIAMALMLAAFAGTIAMGAWLDRADPVRDLVTYTNGVIVSHEGCGRITEYDPVSLEARELTTAVAGCTSDTWSKPPAWSLDGTRLAYIVAPEDREAESSHGAWVFDTASGESRQLDRCPAESSCHDINISPDGSLVAYITLPTEGINAGYSLVVLEVDSGERHVVELTSQPGRPVFSPFGDRLALPMLGGRSGVYIVDVAAVEDGTVGEPTLVHGIVDARDLAWSPDGAWLAMAQWGGLGDRAPAPAPYNGQIFSTGIGIVVARADGSESRVLATGWEASAPGAPTWSADSSTIAYVAGAETADTGDWQSGLFTVGIDGGQPTLIHTLDGGFFSMPAWSPDGEWIAFADISNEGEGATLALVRPDGSETRETDAIIWQPVWQSIPEE